MALLDLALISGFVYLLFRVLSDETYWREAPYPFHIFILLQYALLALLIRVPITSCKAATQSCIVCFLSLGLKINSVVGLYWLHQIQNTEITPSF